MAEQTIIWSEAARWQLHEILAFWVKRIGTSTYSDKLLDMVEARTIDIIKHPLSCRRSEYPDTHVASMGHYSIYYKIAETQIIIMAFWDNRQDPKKLLKLMKTT